jgi:hypothetical protein
MPIYDNNLATKFFSKRSDYPPLAQACPKQAIQTFSQAFHNRANSI